MENILTMRHYLIKFAAKFMVFVALLAGFTTTAFAATASKASRAKKSTTRVVKDVAHKSKKKIVKTFNFDKTKDDFSVNSILEKDPDLAEFAGLIPEDQLNPELFAPETAREETSLSFIWPVDGYLISPYGHREGRMHSGIDIKAAKGSTVVAAEDGEVIFSGRKSGYGFLIEIKHKDGFITRYAHNSKNIVKKGDVVQKGEKIALAGSTGRATTSHVHFEIVYNKKRVNPANFVVRDTFFVLNKQSDKLN